MTAIMAAVATSTAAIPRLYALGSVPASPVYPYGSYQVMFGRPTGYRNDQRHTMRHARLVLQTFGRTTDAATDHLEKVITSLVDTRPVVAGYNCGPWRVEVDPIVFRDPDDHGVMTTTTTFTLVAAKETV